MTTPATPGGAKGLNLNLKQYGLPSLTPRFALETIVLSGLTGIIGSVLGKIVDENYPKADKAKSMFQSIIETFLQIGILGLLLYIGNESIRWGTTKLYKANIGDSLMYSNIVMGLAMITVQKNLQTKLLNL